MPCVRLLFGWFGLLLWLAVTGAALMVVGTHWQELTTNIIDRVLSVDNLLIMAVCYPLVKAAHELGHGYAAKAWGREVREMGIMLLVLFPVPYVDASDASALPDKWKDRKSTRLTPVTNAQLVCRLLLEKKKKNKD